MTHTNNVIVAEADEFDRSFLQLFPEIAVITSMDADHLDIYGDEAHIREAFKAFASQVSGTVIVKKGLDITAEDTEAKILTYSYNDPSADFHAVLTEGDAESVINSNNPGDVKIWTEVEVDVGEVDLPDQDYQEIQIMPGGKLTIKGTIGVTGGRLNFTVYDTDCLDIRELVLVKKHLTPDMVKIRFERGLEINTDLLQATTDEGEIKFDMAEDSYNITIW